MLNFRSWLMSSHNPITARRCPFPRPRHPFLFHYFIFMSRIEQEKVKKSHTNLYDSAIKEKRLAFITSQPEKEKKLYKVMRINHLIYIYMGWVVCHTDR